MLAIQAAKKSGHYFSMNRENFVQLESGAVVAFEEYGDPNGVPVIFCHGWPSSRTMARLTDEPARDLGIRIISPDRPGITFENADVATMRCRKPARCGSVRSYL